ncbi:MAG: TetR/AcrR family transcriptional regulator, partial [Promethearchaeota archaeon]
MPEKSTKSKTRSRTPEKKAARFEKILEAGKKLFIEKGRDGFSLRGLAKVLGMNQNNLYNYVESKRELYIAIRNKFFKQYREENIEIIKRHKSSSLDLLIKIFNHFFNFAESDFGAFAMMHLRTLPPS